MDIDIQNDPLGQDSQGKDVFLKDIWPSQQEINDTRSSTINSAIFRSSYKNVFAGDTRWAGIQIPESERYEWNDDSTYIQNPPYFEGMGMEAEGFEQIKGARILAKLGDSITTDHISPAGAIKPQCVGVIAVFESQRQDTHANQIGTVDTFQSGWCGCPADYAFLASADVPATGGYQLEITAIPTPPPPPMMPPADDPPMVVPDDDLIDIGTDQLIVLNEYQDDVVIGILDPDADDDDEEKRELVCK